MRNKKTPVALQQYSVRGTVRVTAWPHTRAPYREHWLSDREIGPVCTQKRLKCKKCHCERD
jgi:hypothetical protein